MRAKPPIFSPWYYRAKKCIAQNGLTNSKRPESFILGQYPTHFKTGKGSVLVDVRGERYVDYICSLGPNLFGHGNERIARAVGLQLNKGTLFSMGSDVEVEAAERLKGLFPFIDRVKFLKSGTEACSAAIKIARASTKRTPILVDGYHGWADPFIDAYPALGVDPGATKFTYRGVDKHRTKLSLGMFAAVIIEPVELDYSPDRMQWLNQLREDCTKSKTILIFDEIITGFRYPKMSVSVFHGINPDLICLGKAMGGGLPLSAVGGNTKLMEESEYFVSSTFGGDTLALRAFLEICGMFMEAKWSMEDLWTSGAYFLKKFNALCPEAVMIEGYPTRGRFKGDTAFLHLFWQECAKGGILFGPSWFYNYTLVEHNDSTLSICKDIIENIKSGRVKLEGEIPVSPFASKQRK